HRRVDRVGVEPADDVAVAAVAGAGRVTDEVLVVVPGPDLAGVEVREDAADAVGGRTGAGTHLHVDRPEVGAGHIDLDAVVAAQDGVQRKGGAAVAAGLDGNVGGVEVDGRVRVRGCEGDVAAAGDRPRQAARAAAARCADVLPNDVDGVGAAVAVVAGMQDRLQLL